MTDTQQQQKWKQNEKSKWTGYSDMQTFWKSSMSWSGIEPETMLQGASAYQQQGVLIGRRPIQQKGMAGSKSLCPLSGATVAREKTTTVGDFAFASHLSTFTKQLDMYTQPPFIGL